MTTSQDAKDRAQETAAQATDEGKKVADTAKTEVQNVAAEARAQASGLLDEAVTQVNDQSRTQRDRLVATLQTFGDDLEQMASQGGRSGPAPDLARQLAGTARGLSSQLDGREPAELLDEVRRFARRRPGMFLLGALTAGMVTGRLARGAKASTDGSGGRDSAVPGRASGATPAATPVGARGPVSASPSLPPRETGVGGAMGDPLTDPLDADLPERTAP
jgi:hypothetical protein